MSKKRNYDFAGWVTKNDIHCSDGVVIRQDAFKDNNGTKVPLVWNHNYDSPNNVLGHVLLENHSKGIYGYGYFNGTDEAKNAKEMVRHGDVVSMSIGARKIKRSGHNVIHGKIYEVSLVLSGANPGATIESVMHHGEEEEEQSVIYPGFLLHSSDDIIPDDADEEVKEDEDLKEEDMAGKQPTIDELLDSLTDEELEMLAASLDEEDGDYDYEDDDDEYEDYDEGDGETVKQNIFSTGFGGEQEEFLTHSDQEDLLFAAKEGRVDSFRDYLYQYSNDVLRHSVTNIEYLFPDAKQLTKEPVVYKDHQTGYRDIIDSVTKSPFAKVKTAYADLTSDEARAKGYIKGKEKLEQIFPVLKRETTPQTIYKKQKLDRDDVVDITDFSIVAFIEREMRFMLEEEVARAILVGDGRELTDDDKIKEDKIRPVISDDDLYTLKKTYPDAAGFVESVIKGMADYKGSGAPTMYIDPLLLADVKLLKGTDGRWLSGSIPTNSELASQMDIGKIVPTTFMKGKGAVVVNLSDYVVGATEGGKISRFEDFDIDFNQYKYLIETRLCGALTIPHSAVLFSPAGEPETP